MSITVGYALPSHLNQIVELLNNNFLLHPTSPARVRRMMERKWYIILEDNGIVVGIVSSVMVQQQTFVQWYPHLAEVLHGHEALTLISDLYVADGYRNQGWGTKLVKAALNFNSTYPAITISWNRPQGWMAASIFKNLDFKAIGDIEDYLHDECDTAVNPCPHRKDSCQCNSTIYFKN